ncbi:MAG: hypothetical protein ACLFUJ_08830 [Phycisphaerae bacterium]
MISRLRPILIGLTALLAIAWAGGCGDPQAAKRIELRDQLIEAESKIEDLNEEILRLEASVEKQKRLIAELRGLGENRLENLFTVDKIELGRFTGPANLDDKPGQDGVRVRFTPIDRAGTPIKRAGSVKIQLFDLADEDAPVRIGLTEVPVEKIGDYWSGHFGTFHFSIPCRWDRPPSTEEMTIRVAFIEELTGQSFSAQAEVKVDLPEPSDESSEKAEESDPAS